MRASVPRARDHHAPQHADLLPAPEFLAWNTKNVFKMPARRVVLAGATTQAAG